MQNLKLQLKIQGFYFSLLILCFLLLPLGVKGTILYLSPDSGEYYSGDTFLVAINIDTEKECINTVKASLSFPPETLEGIDFSSGNSILTLWPEPPFINRNSGLISFIGGIPGGLCGEGNNLLGKIIFEVKEINEEKVAKIKFLEDSKVLLNDPEGKMAKLTTQDATFKIFVEKLEIPRSEWEEELEKDKIPPEPFEIIISQDPSIFEGKYFIAFSTTDKETGIDHYQIKEGDKDWKRGKSPYLLEDQSLKSIIKVKAVDKAGNERIAEYLPPKKPFPYWILILILIGAGVIWWIWKKYRKQKTENNTNINTELPKI